MDNPVINDIDPDFIDGTSPIDYINNKEYYENDISIDDEFIIYFKDISYIGQIFQINIEDKIIYLNNDTNDIIKININEDNHIILKTENYIITDIEKIIKINVDDFDKVIDIQLQKDIYPELELEVVELSEDKYIYTNIQKKEILLTSLIQSFNIYDNTKKIKELTDIVNNIITLEDDTKYNTPYFKKYILNKNIPTWLLPITNNYKRVYLDDDDEEEESIDDISIEYPKVIKNFKEEYIQIFNINNNNKNNFINSVNNTFKSLYYPTQFINETDGYTCEYEGNFLMNLENFGIDYRHTLNENYVYFTGDKSVLINKEKHILNSFILFPNKLYDLNFNLSLSNKNIPLSLKMKFQKMQNKSNKYDKLKNNITNTIINDINLNENNYDSSKIIIYKSLKNINKENIFKYFDDNLPSIKQIISNIDFPIYNYNDIIIYLIQYDILFDDITLEDRNFMNKLIKNSIKGIETKKLKSKNIIKKDRNIKENIELILEYIFKQTDINIKNEYLKKFINKYTKEVPNSNWLFSTYTNEKILCKHYLSSSKLLDEPLIFNTLKTEFGTEPIDGIIYCKNCGQEITHEDFSILEGFGEGKPISTKAVLEEKEVDIFTDLTEKQLSIVKLIKYISNSMNIDLLKTDIYDITKLYDILNNDEFSDERYSKKNISTISYPSIQKAINSKVDKLKLRKIQLSVQKYIVDSNKLIFIFTCILIYVQFSYNNYQTNIKIINIDKLNYSNIQNDAIQDKGIKLIYQTMKTLTIKNIKNNVWKHCYIFINEYKSVDYIKPENQIINIVKYLLSPYFPITNKIKTYINSLNKFDIGFLKQYWVNFRPLPSNKFIYKINEKIMKEELYNINKKYFITHNITKYALQNISIVRNINELSLYKLLNINISDILVNNSFKELYYYSIYLYGVSTKSNYIKLLVNRFINTVNKSHKNDMLSIFKKYGWEESLLDFKNNKVSYFNLKTAMVDVVKYYNNTDKTGIYYYNLSIFNNTKMILYNLLPKRIYNNNVSSIDDVFSTINDGELLEKIKKRYCYDKYGKLIYNDRNFYHMISIDIDMNKIIYDCDSLISTDNFWNFANELYNNNKLTPIYFKFKYDIPNSDNRLIKFLNFNTELLKNTDISNILHILDKDTIDKTDLDLLSNSFKNIKDDTFIFLDNIITFIKQYDKLNDLLKLNNTNINIFGNEFINIKEIFYTSFLKNKYREMNTYDVEYFINYIFETTSIIKNKRIKNNYIPKWWNQTDYNNTSMKKFINEKELTLYNNTYIVTKTNNSFEKYYDKSIYFTGLLNYINKFKNHINILKGLNNNNFTKNREIRIKKYILSFTIYKIVEYIDLLSDIDSDIHNEQNILYLSIDDDNIDIFDCIDTLTKFSIEIILNILQEFLDNSWFLNINNELLSEKISAQAEREKQELLKRLDIMDPGQRKVILEMQKIGASNWYKELDENALNYINSEEFAEADKKEKEEILNSLHKSIDQNIDAIQIYTGVDEFDSEVNIVSEDQGDLGYYGVDTINEEGEGEDGFDIDYGDI